MKVLKKILLVILGIIGIIFLVYILGPKMHFEDFDNQPLSGKYTLAEVQSRIADRNQNPKIKENNEEQLIWNNGVEVTEYAVVYLHGFSASHEEGAPIHRNIAKRHGANLYLSRLPKHGLHDEEAFLELTPKMMVDYAKEAIKIGKSIGNKVIVVSCSTGGTLSAYLAAEDKDIFAQIMFSPNFEMNDQTTKLLTKPWGLQIARKIKKGNYHEWNTPQRARPYWYHKYRLEGVVALQTLIDKTMNKEVLSQIDQPLFVGYYYKDEENRDFTVSTDRIKEAENMVSTDDGVKVFKTYPDGRAHVFISPFYNPNWEKVQEDVYRFLEDELQMVAAEQEVLVENELQLEMQ
jgi:esterase/lipase